MAHPTTIDRFAIVRPLGTGGMGTVYEAVDPKIDRHVALKVLQRHVLADNPEFIERLWVEVRAANRIRHPGVDQISEARLLEDGTGFLVMDLLEGPTLTQRMKAAGCRLPLARVVQTASTLSMGHKKSIVHRDVGTNYIQHNIQAFQNRRTSGRDYRLTGDATQSGDNYIEIISAGIAIKGPAISSQSDAQHEIEGLPVNIKCN
ncbi:MAG: protein kinase [Polyangia bacterium]